MLSILVLLPLGVAATLLVRRGTEKELKVTALVGAGLTLLWSTGLTFFYDASVGPFQLVEQIAWIPNSNQTFYLGIDGISLLLVQLTAFLTTVCILVSWNHVKIYRKEFFVLLLLIEGLLFGVFLVLDLFLFYVLFESILIPMFLLIGVWGSRSRKIHAAYQFFLYTLIGSVFLLLAIFIMYSHVGTTDISYLWIAQISEGRQIVLWLGFFLSLAVKVPLVPFHLWLPEAHVEAPTTGSILLAGILLKLGTYGFLRFALPLFPSASQWALPLVGLLSLLGILYASLSTIRQIDMKKIIAYSSVAHMSLAVLGLFSSSFYGLQGSVLLMVGHGFVSGALFYCIGVLYDRTKTRLLFYYRGLVQVMPLFTFFYLFFSLSNLSFPGTINFIGEILIFLGLIHVNMFITILSFLGIFTATLYSLWLYNRISYGTLSLSLLDLERREFFILFLFAAPTLVLGFLPQIILNISNPSVYFLTTLLS